jgi:hypothetical protein
MKPYAHANKEATVVKLQVQALNEDMLFISVNTNEIQKPKVTGTATGLGI